MLNKVDEALFHPETDAILLTEVLHALSDPVRISIVSQLLAAPEREMPCGTFQYSVAKSTFSHHIRVLREAGVIWVRHEGTRSMSSLRDADLEARFPDLLGAVMKNAPQSEAP
ncbi:ArsR/SmtB family transcription factor [Fimbriimonas ginsengisoli]|uniref:Transcriptional regulator n=1 Tax=Fimbriimonas ginsengisoli Gsoil 348 TaxID=661478 RepID=A0A068NMD6_FIMGI|nr:helix-turn-helix domain-containing protein [Fimbriimonas ginsengisoli]AIE83945.1 transcriptional regulator [Fimbriimonas ginsengisoli Gsoil 348]